MKQRGLGKGLSALLREEIVQVEDNESVKLLDIDKIEPGSYQPRQKFDDDKIQELANSIAHNGLLQPIIINKNHDGEYQIVAGERRWRACKLIGLHEVPVIIKKLSNKEILEIALIENIQREELSAIEEAEGLERLIKEFNYTQDQVSHAISKSRSHIANLLRLNQLPAAVKDKINQGQISMGHARCLVGNVDAEAIAEQIVTQKLSVRQTESLVKNWKVEKKINDGSKNTKKLIDSNENEFQILEESLSKKLGVKVVIEKSVEGKGTIILHYSNLEELDGILSKL